MRRALLFALLAMMFPFSLSAQTVEELESEGTAAYLAGDYETAILKYVAAYEKLPNPIFQYNLSLCYGKIGNHAKALETGLVADKNKDALDDKTASKNSARIASFLIRLKSEKAAEKMFADAQGDATCSTDADCGGGFYCASDNVCKKQDGPKDPETEYRDRRLGPIGFIGIGLMVVGAGSATGALIVDAGLAPDLKRLDENDLTDDERDALLEDVARRQGQGRVLVLVGAGFGLVGAGLLIYDLVTVEKVPIAVIPQVSGDRVGATITWEF